MAILGHVTRAVIHRFEEEDLVAEVRVHHDRIRVTYGTGIVETWGLEGEKPRNLVLPMRAWRKSAPVRASEHNALRQLDFGYQRDDDLSFLYTGRDIGKSGFIDQRLLIQRVLARLLQEGWLKPVFPNVALDEDLARLRADSREFALTRGFIRGQPGRTTTPQPGFIAAMHMTDWGPLGDPGRPTLETAWRDPRRLYGAIQGVVQRRQDLTRASIAHKLICGRSEGGFPAKAGPKWESPSLHRSILQDLLGLAHRPVVLDLDPGCGARAVATTSLGGIHIVPSLSVVSPEGIAWARSVGAEIVEDDGDVTADVVFVDASDVEGLVEQVETVGRRCSTVVAVLRDRVGVHEALPEASVVRFKPRPWAPDQVMVVCEQQ